jgi:ABC-type uncharacterized transport system substrate-binding protein
MFHVKHVHIHTCNSQPKSFGKNRKKPAISNAIVPVATETSLALERRLPLVVYSRETLEAGALIAYGANQVAMFQRAATVVDRVLKGTKPADLPVEQPTTFELLINAKTAKTLGLEIPHSLLVRADEVIE